MEEFERYIVNNISGEFAILQNTDNKELKMVELLLLPVVKKNDKLIYKDDLYMIDDEDRRKRLEEIKAKLDKIKKN